jgi:2',3'-cyclic-nucleotide 2'-phosphodiesterase/3'-nucleotidase/5'-nucleotidase
MLAAFLAATLAIAPLQDTAHVVLVSTTDIHGHVTDYDYLTGKPFPGGLTRVATVVDSLRRVYPGQVVVVDAGDLLQGDAFASYFATVEQRDPHPVVEALNAIGYDAGTPGNHEFNFGVGFLRRALAVAAFPYVSANIRTMPADTFMLPPYATIRRGPVRIAITGFTTPGVMVWDRDSVRGIIKVDPVEKHAARMLREMRKDADVAIVLLHSGMDGPSSYDSTGVGAENVAASFAQLPVTPDVVVVGHTHREMRDSVLNGVHFVQPRNFAQGVSVMHLDLLPSSAGHWKVVQVRGELIPLAKVAPAPRMLPRLAGADAAVRRWVETPLGDVLEATSTRLARIEPTPLIQFLNEVQRTHAGTQLASTAAFSTTVTMPLGPLTIAQVAGLYPYENTLRAIRLSGAALKAYLEESARYWKYSADGKLTVNDSVPGYNHDMVLGASYDIDVSRPVGDRIRNLAVAGKRVGATDSFSLALNNYRQAGGGGFSMLHDAPVIYDRGESIRDLLIAAARKQGGFDPGKFHERNWRLLPTAAYDQARALAGAPPIVRRSEVPAVPGDTVLLRVLSLNDLHGAIQPRTYEWSNGRAVGGLAVIKAQMDSLEARCGCPTLRLDAGDEMQGTLASNLTYGRATVAGMSALGIRAAAVGNHDLDWGLDTLKARMAQATYPWLITNVIDSATGQRPAWAHPYAMLDVGPRKVAVVGFMTAAAKSIIKAEHVRGLAFPGGRAALDPVLAEVRGQHPDLVILLAHAGDTCAGDTLPCRGEMTDLVHEPGARLADVIVSGHAHRRDTDTLSAVPIIQARSSGTAIGVTDIIRRADGSRVVRMDVVTTFADQVTPDRAIAALVDREAGAATTLGEHVVTTLKLPLPKPNDDDGQYPLGMLIADAQRNAARADVAIMNNGGIRAPGLPAGPVTYAQVFALQPFGNIMEVLEVKGAVLRQALEQGLVRSRPSMHISGLHLRYQPSRPAGKRITEVRMDDGRKLDDKATYTLAVNDFMSTGGSGFTMLTSQKRLRAIGSDLDVLLDYLRKLPQPVELAPGTRIEAEGT